MGSLFSERVRVEKVEGEERRRRERAEGGWRVEGGEGARKSRKLKESKGRRPKGALGADYHFFSFSKSGFYSKVDKFPPNFVEFRKKNPCPYPIVH